MTPRLISATSSDDAAPGHRAPITLKDFIHTVHLLNMSLIALLARLAFIAFFACCLAVMLACVHTRIEPTPSGGWSVLGFSIVGTGGPRYPFTASLTLPHCVQAVCSALLATFGNFSDHHFGWMCMLPWLAKMAVFWVLRVAQIVRTTTQPRSDKEYLGTQHVYAILMLINVIYVLTWRRVCICMWLRCSRMHVVRMEVLKFARWRFGLNRILSNYASSASFARY